MVSHRIADREIYNNRDFYDAPKEYFSLAMGKIMERNNNPESLLDIGCANGAFLFHAQTMFPKTQFWGVEPISELADIAQESTNARIIRCGLEDVPKKLSSQKFKVITLMGVLGIFEDAYSVVAKLNQLILEGGIILIFSPFNEEDVDVILRYRRAPVGPWEAGHNLFSMRTIEDICRRLGLRFDWTDFVISKAIPKTDDPMRSWTESFRGNKHQLVYGTNMFSTMKLLVLHRETGS